MAGRHEECVVNPVGRRVLKPHQGLVHTACLRELIACPQESLGIAGDSGTFIPSQGIIDAPCLGQVIAREAEGQSVPFGCGALVPRQSLVQPVHLDQSSGDLLICTCF